MFSGKTLKDVRVDAGEDEPEAAVRAPATSRLAGEPGTAAPRRSRAEERALGESIRDVTLAPPS